MIIHFSNFFQSPKSVKTEVLFTLMYFSNFTFHQESKRRDLAMVLVMYAQIQAIFIILGVTTGKTFKFVLVFTFDTYLFNGTFSAPSTLSPRKTS